VSEYKQFLVLEGDFPEGQVAIGTGGSLLWDKVLPLLLSRNDMDFVLLYFFTINGKFYFIFYS